MVDPYQMTRDLRNTDNFDVEEADTWQWWNKFRAYGDYSIKFKVALELTADLPSKEELRRWLGEPVELLIITSDVFISNANNYPVLPKAHKSVVVQFLKMKASLAIKTNIADSHHLRNCVAYLKHLIGENQKDVDVMNGCVYRTFLVSRATISLILFSGMTICWRFHCSHSMIISIRSLTKYSRKIQSNTFCISAQLKLRSEIEFRTVKSTNER